MNSERIKYLQHSIKKDKENAYAFALFLVFMVFDTGISIKHQIYEFLVIFVPLGAIDIAILAQSLKSIREKQAELKIRRGR